MAAPQPEHTFPSYLVITNISKKQNISTLISIAVGFGIENILIGNRTHFICSHYFLPCFILSQSHFHSITVGQPSFEVETHVIGSKIEEVKQRVTFIRFDNLKKCREYLTEHQIR
jgi:hypothetical protein